MYDRSAAFVGESKTDRRPMFILGLRAPGGRRLHAKHTPSLAQTGYTSSVYADGVWLADGYASAGIGAEPLLARRKDVLRFGAIKESLAGRRGEPLSILAGGRTVEVQVVLENNVEPEGTRYYSRIAAIEGLVGLDSELEATYPGLGQRDALRRFSGRVRRAELTRESVALRLRAVRWLNWRDPTCRSF